jgi:simple sugar transport system substrate-binding protein
MRYGALRVAAACAVLSLGVAACGDDKESGNASEPGAASAAETKTGTAPNGFTLSPEIADRVKTGKPHIVVSTSNTSVPFAKPLREGAEKAAAEFDVDVDFIGPATGKPEDQVSELQTLIAQNKVDAIAVAPVSNDAMKPIVAQAIKAGIPIISFNTNNETSEQLAFVGQDLKESGRVEAAELLKLTGDKKGKVVVFSVDTGAGWSNDRMAGFKEGIAGSGLEAVGPVNTGFEPGQIFNAVQNAMKANSDAIAVASLDCCSITGAAKWAADVKTDIPVLGHDAVQQTLDYIKDGVIDVSLGQDPVSQTYGAVKMLDDYLRRGGTIEDIQTPIVVITKDNVDDIKPEG